NAPLEQMARITASGYRRSQARELSAIARSADNVRDRSVDGVSEWRSLTDTFAVEALRSDPATRYAASDARERVMKRLFFQRLTERSPGKVFLRFGRNHLHRG